jgi:predicted negative regulator of RcsB-dependent stress response
MQPVQGRKRGALHEVRPQARLTIIRCGRSGRDDSPRGAHEGPMPETIHCPSCGAENAADAASCVKCNFPLVQRPVSTPAAEPEFKFDPGPRPVPRRERPASMEPIQMQIWLFAGIAVILGIVYFAAQGFWKSNAKPVEGANAQQEQRADAARAVLAKDSTNLMARIELANVLYDTGNWSDAIVHYKSALRQDPNRATTIVDMGVCYYNLGRFAAAESLFQHALVMDPHQAVALFNLGIIAEAQGRWDEALSQFHRAMESGPPDEMKQLLQQHIQAAMAKTGKTPPPLGQ